MPFFANALRATARFLGLSRKRGRADGQAPEVDAGVNDDLDDMDVAPDRRAVLAVFAEDTIGAFVDGRLQLRALAGNIRGTGYTIMCQTLDVYTQLGERMAAHAAAMEKHAVDNSITIAAVANLSGIPVRVEAEKGSGTEHAQRSSKRRAVAGEGQRSQSHTHLMGAMTSIAFAIHSADYLRAFVLAASFRPAPRPRTLFPPGPAPANPPPNPRT